MVITLLRYVTICLAGSVYLVGTLLGGGTGSWERWLLVGLALCAGATWSLAALLEGAPEPRVGMPEGFSIVSAGRLPRLLGLLAILLLGLVWLQSVDLPAGLQRLLSPRSAELCDENLSGLAGLDDWQEGEPRDPHRSISVAPHATREAWWRLLSGVILFFALLGTIRTRTQLYVAVGTLLAAGVIQMGLGLVQAFLPEHLVTGTYPNRNYFAGVLEMTAPLALGLTISQRVETRRDMSRRERFVARLLASERSSWKVALWMVFLGMAAAVFLSRSRMGVVGLVLGACAIPFYLVRGQRRGKVVPVLFWCSLGGMLLLLLASILLKDTPTVQRFSLLLSGGDVGAMRRLEVWKDCLRIFADFPVLGAGLGTFGELYQTYQTPSFQLPHFQYAHNDWLELLLEVGVIGFLIAALGLLLWCLGLFHRSGELRTYQRGLRAGVFAGVAAILAHSLVDFNLQVPANGYLFVGLLAVGTATGALPELKLMRTRRKR
jgi:O-antigen ligase